MANIRRKSAGPAEYSWTVQPEIFSARAGFSSDGQVAGRKVLNGGDKNDKLAGTSGNDKLDGKGGNDTIDGKGGNDTLIGGTGRNTITGGAGVDTVVLDGDAALWKASHGDNGQMTFSRKGTVTVIDSGVEFVRFKDGTINRTAPAKPEITGVESAHGSLADGGNTVDTTLVINGTADAFAVVVVTINGVIAGNVQTNGSGVWALDLSGSPLAEGAHDITATASLGLPGEETTSATFDVSVHHVVDLATLSAGQGFIIQGDVADDRAGFSVSSAGDVNGDGFDDLIVGAVGGDDGGNGAGEAYVIFGTDQGFGSDFSGRRVIDLATITAAQGFIIQGDAAGDRAGFSVSSAGDVNGDGFEDLIVGADLGSEAYVIFGADQGFGSDVSGRHVIDLATITAAQGFIVQGDAADDRAGCSVSSAGDVNGDGFDDLIVGAFLGDDDGAQAGEAYVIFGTDQGFGSDVSGHRVIDLTNLAAAQGFIIQGDAAGDLAGGSVSSAGDVNGDGFEDLIVGADRGDGGGAYAGEAYVIFGSDQGFGANVSGRQVIDLTTLSAARGFIILGDAAGDHAGVSVSSAGDVNGDGFDDIIVGAYRGVDGGNLAGEAYVVFGSDQGFGIDVAGRQIIDLTNLTTAQGFIIQGDAANDQAGISVSSAGDVNGDGFDDMIVGAYSGDNGGTNAGEAYVIFGSDQGFGIDVAGRQVIDLAAITAAQGFIIQGDTTNDNAGRSVSSAGDVNGDGFDDLLVGAPNGDDGDTQAGEAYIVFGGTFGNGAAAVQTTGTLAAEFFIGGAGNDRLDGRGGADRFRAGAGDDIIRIANDDVVFIDAGLGQDTVALSGSGITLDARDWSNAEMSGIEAFDLTGTGDNRLILEASDVFHFSTTGNTAFTAAASHNSLVISGNAGDTLELIEYTSSGAGWDLTASNKTLAGGKNGTFDIYNLVDGDANVLASVAVDSDVSVVI